MISTPATESPAEVRSAAIPPAGDEPHPRLKVQARASHTIRRHFIRALRRIAVLAAVDLAVLDLAGNGIHWLRTASWTPSALAAFFPVGFMGGWGAHAAIVTGLIFAGAYASQEHWAYPLLIFRGVAFGSAIALWQSIDTRGLSWTAVHWVSVAMALGVLLTLARGLLRTAVLRYRSATQSGERVILVGDPNNQEGTYAAQAVLRWPGIQSLGWLSEQVDVDDYLGHPSAVWEILHQTRTDTVVLCDTLTPKIFHTVVEAAAVAGCRVLSVRSRATMLATQPRPMRDRRLKLMELTFPAGRAGQAVLKRAFDLVASTVLLLLLTPLFLVIAFLIKLDSRGPVFFIQERVGKAGQVFPMFKFRSMRVGADAEKAQLAHMNQTGDPRLFKIPDDPRITRVGAFLRRWSLDELPQLFNVWLGQMSLVGPRPERPELIQRFREDWRGYMIRQHVKAGMTGWAQVNGLRGDTSLRRRLRYDLHYIRCWSIGFDLKILWLTIFRGFTHRNAH